MNTETAIPRVGAQHMPSMIGRKVLLVGRIETISGSGVQLTAADGGRVTVLGQGPFDSTLVEVEGTVMDAHTIQEETHVNLNDAFGEHGG
jgi:hypothetical protein